MMTKIFKFILLFVSLFVLVGMIGILSVGVSFGNLPETDVKTYSAEVESVVCNTIGMESTYRIYTKEYERYLLVGQEVTSLYDLSKVQKGDNIVFEIESIYDEFLNSNIEADVDFFVTVVSLECEGETIFTLADYNEIYERSTREPLLVNIMLIIASFVVFVISFISIIKDIITRKRNKTGPIRGRPIRGRFYD